MLCIACALAAGPAAQAASSCSSDGQPRPRALLERFISADCAQCWTEPAAQAGALGVALDWIVPGRGGEDAPLSAAATRDALRRLEALGWQAPERTRERSVARFGAAAAGRLRVAQGPAFNGYIGTSIEWRGPATGAHRAWLALVETLPAGTEGSPVQRQLVRNLLPLEWPAPGSAGAPRAAPGKPGTTARRDVRHFETRPMRIPEGARPDRLRVVGWVEDEKGRLLTLAQSACAPPPKGE